MDTLTERMMQKSTGQAVDSVAAVFGLEMSAVTRIVQVGIPMQMWALSENRALAQKMYASALQMSPNEVRVFYSRLANDSKLADISREEYEQMYSESAGTITSAAAEAAGVEAGVASLVMGAILPAIKMDLKEAAEAEDIDAGSFSAWISNKVVEDTL